MKRGYKINLFIFLIFLSSISLISASADYSSCAIGETCINLHHGSIIDLTFNSICHTITNNHASNNYFIPPTTRTADFNSFITNPPLDIVLTDCVEVRECAGKNAGTDCNFQSGTCYGSDGGLLTPGLGTVVLCLDPIGKCDATGNCISWVGKGCDDCPFGESSHSCALDGNQGRASDKGKVWTDWHDDINPICESSYGCGFLWLSTCWSKKYWQIKP